MSLKPKKFSDIQIWGDIESFIKQFNITNYTIQPDGTIDVRGDVELRGKVLTGLPKFGEVTGTFDCCWNQLTSLEGAPKKVGKHFKCSHNKLTSLEGGPEIVGGDFRCGDNQLTNLEFSPTSVGRDFSCDNNQITTLEGSPKKIGRHFSFYLNRVEDLTGGPKEINGKLTCHANNLINLKDLPKGVTQVDVMTMLFQPNPVEIIVKIFGTEKAFFESLKYNYFTGGNKIHESRFVMACDDLGVKAPDDIKGYVWV